MVNRNKSEGLRGRRGSPSMYACKGVNAPGATLNQQKMGIDG